MHKFQENIKTYRQQQTHLKQKLEKVGYTRVVIFLITTIGSSWLFYNNHLFAGLLFLSLFLTLFIISVINYNKTHNQLARIRCYIQINQQYIDRTSSAWQNFRDKGIDFFDKNHPYSSDLDIFGQSSLFQWLNTAVSYYGRLKLAQLLSKTINNKLAETGDANYSVQTNSKKDHIVNIKARQQAIVELANKNNFTQELQTQAILAEQLQDKANPISAIRQNPENFLQAVELKQKDAVASNDKLINITEKIYTKFSFVFYLLPMLTLGSIVLLFTSLKLPLAVPVTLIVVQLLITTGTYFYTVKKLAGFSKFQENIDSYQRMVEVVEGETFADPYLQELQNFFYSGKLSASQQLKKLETVAAMVDLRNSVLSYFLLSGLLLWDYHCLTAYQKWCRQYGVNARQWLETVGELEAISSLAVVKKIKPNWTFPEVFSDETKLTIEAEKIGHPLIPDNDRVCNDFEIVQGQAAIITGSNMSGKTTMLRTIAINLVLAYAGAPVCAKRLQCSLFDIYTSMRITDDLSSGTSSFYAELLRIKQIIEFAKEEKPLLFLIDEIFRGTNSRDRIIGAKSVLNNLSKAWIIGLISTHDFELCELDNNYHFTEHYIDGIIKFDYIIRTGRSQTTNARHLMRMVGIEIAETL